MTDAATTNRCRLCGRGVPQGLRGKDGLEACDVCGAVLLASRHMIAEADEYYADADSYASNVNVPSRVRLMRLAARQYLGILKKFVPPAGKRFLDIGANAGVLVDEAKKEGFDALGLEANVRLVEYAKAQGISMVAGSTVGELPGTFDAVAVMHVLEHLADPHAILEDIHAKLRAGGFLIIEVPNIESYLARKDGVSWKYIAREHVTYFSPETLTALLRKHGFEVVYRAVRNHFVEDLSIRQLLHYFAGPPSKRFRFFMKQKDRPIVEVPRPVFLKRILKRLLIAAIGIFKRGDFLLVVAKKRGLHSPEKEREDDRVDGVHDEK